MTKTNAKEQFAVAYKQQKENKQEVAPVKEAPKQKAPAQANEAVEAFESQEEQAPTRVLPKLKQEFIQDTSTWYLGREDDLAIVTDKSENPDLGLKSIQIVAPHADQAKYNVIMNLNVTLAMGGNTDLEIRVRRIEVRLDNNGVLRLNYPFHMVRGESGNNRYYESVSLGRLLTAQLLSHAHSAIDWSTMEEE